MYTVYVLIVWKILAFGFYISYFPVYFIFLAITLYIYRPCLYIYIYTIIRSICTTVYYFLFISIFLWVRSLCVLLRVTVYNKCNHIFQYSLWLWYGTTLHQSYLYIQKKKHMLGYKDPACKIGTCRSKLINAR